MPSQIWPAAITLLNLLLLIGAAMVVGKFRGKYKVPAPALTGDPMFERAYGVQRNTLENTVLFLPALWLAAHWGSWYIVAGAGSAWIIGRVIYAVAYLNNPAKRGAGFGIAFLANIVLIADAGIGVLRAVFV